MLWFVARQDVTRARPNDDDDDGAGRVAARAGVLLTDNGVILTDNGVILTGPGESRPEHERRARRAARGVEEGAVWSGRLVCEVDAAAACHVNAT